MNKKIFLVVFIMLNLILSSCNKLADALREQTKKNNAAAQQTQKPREEDLDKRYAVAIELKQFQIVREVLEDGADPNYANGISAVSHSLTKGSFDIARYIIEHGADPNLANTDVSLLMLAAKSRNADMCQLLIDKGADINFTGIKGYTALDYAVYTIAGDDVLKTLMDNGAKIRIQTLEAALSTPYQYGRIQFIVKSLLKQGINTGLDPRLEAAILGDMPTLKGLLKKSKYTLDDTADHQILFNIAAYGSPEVFDIIFKRPYTLDEKFRQSGSLLHTAAAYGNLEMINHLLDLGMDINKSGYPDTALTAALENNQNEAAALLIKKGIQVECFKESNVLNNSSTYDYNFIAAAGAGNVEGLELLRQSGSSFYDFSVFWAMMEANRYNHINVFQYFLDLGVDVNIDVDGGSLLEGCANGDLDIVKLLVEHGANVNGGFTPEDPTGYPLYSAAQDGRMDVVEYLIEKGADVNIRDVSGGESIVLGAVNFGRLEIAKLLVEKGAELEYEENGVKRSAILFGQYSREFMALFIEQGLDLNFLDSNENTPLMNVAKHGDIKVVELLLENGADYSLKNFAGQTAMDLAVENNNPKIVKLLEDAENGKRIVR